MPGGFQRLGSVLVVKLPEPLRPHFPAIASAYAAELGVGTVLRRRGPIEGDFRLPSTERLLGTTTETETRENGVVYRFDAARVMFSQGNRSERVRSRGPWNGANASRTCSRGSATSRSRSPSTAPPPTSSPARRTRSRSATYRRTFGATTSRVGSTRILGPNESAPLAESTFDRVVLGFLPTAVPWVPRAVGLLKAPGVGSTSTRSWGAGTASPRRRTTRARRSSGSGRGPRAVRGRGQGLRSRAGPCGRGRSRSGPQAGPRPSRPSPQPGGPRRPRNAPTNRSMSAGGFENDTRTNRPPNWGESSSGPDEDAVAEEELPGAPRGRPRSSRGRSRTCSPATGSPGGRRPGPAYDGTADPLLVRPRLGPHLREPLRLGRERGVAAAWARTLTPEVVRVEATDPLDELRPAAMPPRRSPRARSSSTPTRR